MPARVDIDGHDVVISVTGLDRLWAAAGSIRIPRAQVTSAAAVARKDVTGGRVRVFGTYFPGVIKAGRFWGGEFWLVRRADRVLVVESSGKPRRVVVETADPDGDAARILASR